MRAFVIEYRRADAHGRAMMNRCLVLAILLLLPALGQAACYADYKAKQDAPLRLHYGVIQIDGACTVQSAARQGAPRLAAQGWVLLTILSVFDESGLAARQADAGQYFLRF